MIVLLTTLLLTAACLHIWPERPGTRRLHHGGQPSVRLPALPARWRRRIPFALVAGPAVAACVTLDTLAAGGVLLLAVVAYRRYRGGVRLRSSFENTRRLAEALRALVDELRAGVGPAAAATEAARAADPETARALRRIVAMARLGGRPDTAVTTRTTDSGRGVAARIGHAWQLSQQHGLPLADIMNALRSDVIGQVRFGSEVHARMAGVRTSAVVLAVLPVVGVLLGVSMGTHPIRVLTDTDTGQLLLALGCVLDSLGLLWSDRIARSGVGL